LAFSSLFFVGLGCDYAFCIGVGSSTASTFSGALVSFGALIAVYTLGGATGFSNFCYETGGFGAFGNLFVKEGFCGTIGFGKTSYFMTDEGLVISGCVDVVGPSSFFIRFLVTLFPLR